MGSASHGDLLVVERFLDRSTSDREFFALHELGACRRTFSTDVPGHHPELADANLIAMSGVWVIELCTVQCAA